MTSPSWILIARSVKLVKVTVVQVRQTLTGKFRLLYHWDPTPRPGHHGIDLEISSTCEYFLTIFRVIVVVILIQVIVVLVRQALKFRLPTRIQISGSSCEYFSTIFHVY